MSNLLTIEEDALTAMLQNASDIYPEECCGFFFGKTVERQITVTLALNVANNTNLDKRKYYDINPLDYMSAENFAEENKLVLLGVFHSHPDEGANPSRLDTKNALQNFLYIIMGITLEEVSELKCWQLNNNYDFTELTVVKSPIN
jgi:proteasome lid subunit RPN8/RPN11